MLYPNVAPEAVRQALRRTSYDTEQERQAETAATIILQRASVLDVSVPAIAVLYLSIGNPKSCRIRARCTARWA